MKKLTDKVAVVAGGSRGAGRGIARALGEAGATVYVAARTVQRGPKPRDGAPGTIEETAAEVTARGGRGIPLRCDLSDPAQVEALFERVEREQGRLDVMTCSAWAANFMPVWSVPFWELSAEIWRETLETFSNAWNSSIHAVRLMVKQKGGLVVHVTDNPLPEQPSGYRGQILHDLGHETINRMILDMSMSTKKHKIAVVGLNPGFMRTERVWMHMTDEQRMRQFRFDLSETTEYIGRAVVALAADKKVIAKNGQLLWVPDLAEEYNFTDVDGRRIPRFDPSAPRQPYPVRGDV